MNTNLKNCEELNSNSEKNEGGILMHLPNNIKNPAIAAAMALCAVNASNVLAQNMDSKEKLEELSNSVSHSTSDRENINTESLPAIPKFNPYLEITYGALHMKSNASLGKIPLTKEYIKNIDNPLDKAIGDSSDVLVKVEDTPLNEEPITGDNAVRIFIDSITMTSIEKLDIKTAPLDVIAGKWETRFSSFTNEELEGFALVLNNLKSSFSQNGVEDHLNVKEFYHGLVGAATVWTTGMRKKFEKEGREIPETLKEGNSLALPGDIYKVLSATSENPYELKNHFFKVFPTDSYQEMTGAPKGEGYILPKNPNLELLSQLQEVLGDEIEVPEYFDVYAQYLDSYKESIAYIEEAAKRNHKSSNKKLYKETAIAKKRIDDVQEMPSNMQALIAQRYEVIVNSDMSVEEKDSLVAKLFRNYEAVTSSMNELAGGEDVKIIRTKSIYNTFNENKILLSEESRISDSLLEHIASVLASSHHSDKMTDEEKKGKVDLINTISDIIDFGLKNT